MVIRRQRLETESPKEKYIVDIKWKNMLEVTVSACCICQKKKLKERFLLIQPEKDPSMRPKVE